MWLCWKKKDNSLLFSELIKSYVKNVFLCKVSSLCIEFGIRWSFHYEKSREILACPILSLNAQLKVIISEGYVGETKMMPDFETIYKITKLSPD